MVGRILATANENVPVRLMNPSNEELILYKGTVVGEFQEVNELTSQVTSHIKKNSALPEQLEDLVKQASYSHLLCVYSSVCAISVLKPLCLFSHDAAHLFIYSKNGCNGCLLILKLD